MLSRLEEVLSDCERYLERHECDAFAGCSICTLYRSIVDGRRDVELELQSAPKK